MAHSPESQSQVRALAHRLAAGQMSWADYREQRAAAVAAVTRGGQPLEYGPAEIFGDVTAPKEHELSQVLIDLEELEREPRRWPAWVAVGALAVALLVAGWVLWRASEPPVVATAPVVVMSDAEAALDGFLARDEWSADAMQTTLAEWQRLDDGQRAAARTTATWRRLRAEIRSQMNEQQVLATVDETGESAEQVQRLEAFLDGLQN